MKTTYFRPSIHGWTFGNDWRRSYLFDTVDLDMGFCGGMCWRALQRFFNAIPIPRDLSKPSQGDALHEELWDAQVKSVPARTLWKIYKWQMSPNLSHRSNPLHSLGHRTQRAWPKVKKSLDASIPVTITLVAHANDANLFHLTDSHRVVAYAYEVKSTVEGDGSPGGAHSKVTIWIYDPNYENDDGVSLTFYLGAKRNRIRLSHSKGAGYTGFFKDDIDRNYAYTDATFVRVDTCEQTGISSASRADYDFKFSWQSRIIPYFKIIINGDKWKYNTAPSQARSQHEPKNKDEKQCSSRKGSLNVRLKLPRSLSTVEVQLLGDPAYLDTVEVDAKPSLKCFPYIRERALGDAPNVCEKKLLTGDLFIKHANPSDLEVQQVDTSLFRWVTIIRDSAVIDNRDPDEHDLYTARLQTVESKSLGNVSVPVFANFIENNLAPPIEKSGVVRTIKSGVLVQTDNLATLTDQAQKIFNGFVDNPADYDNDTRVEFTYQAKDKFGVVAKGKAIFFGKSILYTQGVIGIYQFDFSKLARLEMIARELIERGLIDVAIDPPRGWRGPFPDPSDPVRLLKRLRRSRQLQNMVNQKFQSLWGKRRLWKQIWTAQEELLKEVEVHEPIYIEGRSKKGKILEATKQLSDDQLRKFDTLMLNIFVNRTVNSLKRDRNLMNKLMSL